MNEIEEAIETIKQNIFKIEINYAFVNDYHLITAILNKLGVDKIELNETDIYNNLVYITERRPEEKKIIIKRGD